MKFSHTFLNVCFLVLGFWFPYGLSQIDPPIKKFSVYVNNSASFEGIGTKEAPFLTIQEALKSIVNSYFKIPHDMYEILLAPTDSAYTFPAMNITNPKNLSLDMRTINVGSSELSSQNCEGLARVEFPQNGMTVLSFTSILSLRLNSISILNPIQGVSQLRVDDLDSFELSNSCINISKPGIVKTPHAGISISNTNKVIVDKIALNRTVFYHMQPLIQASGVESLLFNNTEMFFVIKNAKNLVDGYLLYFTNSKLISIDNLIIESSEVSLTQLLDISDSSEASLSNITMRGPGDRRLSLRGNIFSFKDLEKLTVTHLEIENHGFLGQAAFEMQIFALKNILHTKIQQINLTSSTFRSDGASSIFVYSTDDAINGNGTLLANFIELNFVNIDGTTMANIGFFAVDSQNSATVKDFSVSNVNITRSTLTSSNFLNFEAKKSASNLQISNFFISKSNILNTKILSFEGTDNSKITNITCEDSSFQGDGYTNYYFVDLKENSMTEIEGLTIRSNQFRKNPFIIISKLPQHVLIVGADITSNTLIDSPLIKMENSNAAENVKEVEYSVLFIQEITVRELVANNSKSVFEVAGPFVFLVDSTFKDIVLNSGTLISFGGVKWTALGLSSSTYIYNKFSKYPRLIEFLDYNIRRGQRIGFDDPIELQYRVQDNKFENCSVKYNELFMDGMIHSIHSTGLIEMTELKHRFGFVIINSNSLKSIDTGMINNAPFIFIQSAVNVQIIGNQVIDIEGRAEGLVTLEKLEWANLTVSQNAIERSSGPGFMKLISVAVENLNFSGNSIRESNLAAPFLVYSVINQNGDHRFFNFRDNLIDNCTYLESSNGLMLISIQQTTLDVSLLNTTIKNLKATPSTKSSTWTEGGSAVKIMIGNAPLSLINSSFEVLDSDSNIVFLTLQSHKLRISNVSFWFFGRFSNDIIVATSNDVVVENSAFFDEVFFSSEDYVVMSLRKMYPGPKIANISFFNNRYNFYETSSSQGIEFHYPLCNTTLLVRNNSFRSSSSLGTGSWMTFKRIYFDQFTALENVISLGNAASAGNWIKFSNCKGNALMKDNKVIVKGENGFTFAKNLLGLGLNLFISEVQILQNHTQNEREIPIQSSFQLLDINQGKASLENIALKDFALSGPLILLRNDFLEIILEVQNVTLSNLNQTLPKLTHKKDQALGGLILLADFDDMVKRNDILISLLNCSFQNINIEGKSGILHFGTSIDYNLYVINTAFSNIASDQGPAINLKTAPTEGGVSLYSEQRLALRNCSFVNNSARQFGGAIYVQSAELHFENVYFQNNTANQGNSAIFLLNVTDPHEDMKLIQKKSNLKEDEIRLGLLKFELSFNSYNHRLYELTENKELVIENVTSLELQSMMLKLKDALGREVSDISSTISLVARVTSSNQSQYNYKNGTLSTFCKGSECFINDPHLLLGGHAGDIDVISIDYSSELFHFRSRIRVIFRDCIPGEIKNDATKSCVPCPSGKYSLKTIDTECKKCPAEAQDCFGSSIILKVGYWRRNYSTDSIHSCGSIGPGEQSRCRGEDGPLCEKGYMGSLCHQCNMTDGYVRTGSETKIQCVRCLSSTQNNGGADSAAAPSVWKFYASALLFFTAFFAFEIYYILTAIKYGKLYYEAVANDRYHVKISFGPYLNLIITYFQIITIVSSFEVETFKYLFSFTSILGEPSAKVFFSLDCILLHWGLHPESLLRVKVIFLLASPVLKFLVVIVYNLIKGLNNDRKMTIIVAGLSMFLLEQPQIVKKLIAYVHCRKLVPDDPKSYVLGDEFFACDDDDYYSFKNHVVIPAIVFFCFLPFALFLFLYYKKKRNDDRLDTEWMRRSIGVLYNGYTKEAYYWGLVMNYSKIGLIILTQTFIYNTRVLVLLLVLWFYVYKSLMARVKPYLELELFYAEKYSLYAYLITVFCSFFMIQSEDAALDVFCVIVIAVANVIALGYIGKQLIIISKQKGKKLRTYKEKVMSLIKRWSKRKKQRSGSGIDESLLSNSESIVSSSNNSLLESSYEILEHEAAKRSVAL